MSTRNLPGSEAARHGTGDADLTIMPGAHAAFRRDLVRLARAATFADVTDALSTSLSGHLSHEERDGLPLIGYRRSSLW